MKRALLLVFLPVFFVFNAYAQEDLFGKTEKLPSRKGFVIGVNGAFDMPAADMAKRFGISYRVGASMFYKTKSNWMIGPKVDFILGDRIKEDSLLSNLKNSDGNILTQDGERIAIKINEHGYMIGMQVGKLIPLSKTSSENGVLVMATVGFMQHKINLFDRDKAIPALRNDYKKGYDRLSNGLFIEGYVGYNYFANNGLLNFHIGLDVAAGFTKLRRDYLYDVMHGDDKQRVDVLFGIRGGWYIPMFKRKSEEFYFD